MRSDLSPDGLFSTNTSGRRVALYRLRFVAIPEEDLNRIAQEPIENFAPRTTDNDDRAKEIRQRFQSFVSTGLADPNEAFAHELLHHQMLLQSSVWPYAHVLLLAKRLAFARWMRKLEMEQWPLGSIARLQRDVVLLQRLMYPVEEHRVACLTDSQSRIDKRLSDMHDADELAECLRSKDFVLRALQMPTICSGSLRGMSHARLSVPGAVLEFIRRHPHVALNVAQDLHHVVAKAIRSPKSVLGYVRSIRPRAIRRSPTKLKTDDPGATFSIRTYGVGGLRAFDTFALQKDGTLNAKSLEATLTDGYPCFDQIRLANTMTEIAARIAVSAKSAIWAPPTYEFWSRWVYGTSRFAHRLREVDETIAQTCREILASPIQSSWATGLTKLDRRYRSFNLATSAPETKRSRTSVHWYFDARYSHGL